jgi:MobA/MobL family
VAKAAYRSAECLYDERIGQSFDYRGGAERVIDTWVMARENAPAWMQHAPREARQRAWNEAERADDNPKARIATELVVGLPHELTAGQRKNLLSGFVRRLVEKHGVFADVSMHTAHDERNIHAHILLSHRELGPDGFGEIANRRTITRKHRGQVKEMTTAGIAATPADVKFLRKEWADHVNSAYQRAGLDIRVDHRSFEDRGLQKVPTIHLGPKATAAERRGHHTDRGDTNRIIEFGNAELRRLEDDAQRQDAEIIDLQAKLAERPGQRRRPESEDMDDDIATKQRQQRQAAEDRQAAIYNDMVADKNRADRFIKDWQRDHDFGEQNRRKLREEEWRRVSEGDISDVRVRALIAAGESRDFVQAVRREGAMISEEHAARNRDIALQKDPDKKHLIELKRDIEHADYMALANERIGAMSNLHGEQYKEAQRQQEEWERIGTKLRKERLELHERMADQEAQKLNEHVEAFAARINAARTNAADRKRAEFRADIRGNTQPDPDPNSPAMREVARMHGMDEEQKKAARPAPETPRTAAQAHEAAPASSPPGSSATRATEPERPAEVIYLEPTPPTVGERIAEVKAARENTDARQSTTAENVEITDSKAAKKAALAQMRTETEQSIAHGHGRGHGHSR